MIHINNNTTQQEIINLLLSKLSEQGNLYIEVLSLPYFLASIPSIKVFQYKIQKYPRPIFWHSHDREIFSLLKDSDFNVDFPPALDHKIDKKPATIINLRSQLITESENFVPSPNFKNNLFESPNFVEPSHSNVFNLSQLTNPIDFSSSSVLDEFRKKHLKKEPKPTIKQDLDQWLEKIESTKSALSKFQVEAIEQKHQFSKKEESSINLFKSLSNPFVYRGFASLILMVLVFGFWYYYPTNKYKLDVVPTTKQEAVDTKLPESIFQKTQAEITVASQVESTGQKTTMSTTRAIGKVILINTSSNPVDFNRDGLILLSEVNGLEYSHKSNSNEPKVFTIPAKNSNGNQKVEIEIQAVETGEKFNLPVNSVFRIYNLKGEAMGASFKAISTTEIKVSDSVGEKIFSEDDMSLLRTKLEKNLLEEKNKKIQNLKDNNFITNPAWVKLNQSNYTFSDKIGSLSKSVTAQAVANIEFLALPKLALTTSVQDKFLNREISDITIVDTTVDDSTDKKFVVAKLFVSYLENPESLKYEIQNKVKSLDFSTASVDLQASYPNVKKVSKEFSGVNLPMIKPRNKIEINQVGEK
jgi:hypothetical protein